MWLTLGCVSSCAPFALAQHKRQGHELPSDTPAVIRKVLEQGFRARYSGTRLVELRKGGTWEKRTELVMSDGPRRRIEFQRGSPQFGEIIFEFPDKRLHYFPATNECLVLPPMREEFMGRLRRATEIVYGGRQGDGPKGGGVDIRIEPGTSIANRRTQLISIVDRRGNPMQKIWVDQESGLLLKREMYDFGGAMVANAEFIKVDINPNLRREDFELKRRDVRFIRPAEQASRIAKELKLPAFGLRTSPKLRLESARKIKFGTFDALALVYNDPQGRLTLFAVDSTLDKAKLDRLSKSQGVNSAVAARGGGTLILIGNRDSSILERMIRDIVPLKQD